MTIGGRREVLTSACSGLQAGTAGMRDLARGWLRAKPEVITKTQDAKTKVQGWTQRRQTDLHFSLPLLRPECCPLHGKRVASSKHLLGWQLHFVKDNLSPRG